MAVFGVSVAVLQMLGLPRGFHLLITSRAVLLVCLILKGASKFGLTWSPVNAFTLFNFCVNEDMRLFPRIMVCEEAGSLPIRGNTSFTFHFTPPKVKVRINTSI